MNAKMKTVLEDLRGPLQHEGIEIVEHPAGDFSLKRGENVVHVPHVSMFAGTLAHIDAVLYARGALGAA